MGNRIDDLESRREFDLQKGARIRHRLALLGITFCLIALGLSWVWRENIFYYRYHTGAILPKVESPPAQITRLKNDEATSGSRPGIH